MSHIPPEAILVDITTLSVGVALRFSAGAEPHHLDAQLKLPAGTVCTASSIQSTMS